jgi:Cu/Ag efflux pump CusA
MNTIPKNLLSKKTVDGMSLTIDDQKWIKVLLDTQNDVFNEAFDTNIKELTGALAEVIQASNARMFEVLDQQTIAIKAIGKDMGLVVIRLDSIEKRLEDIEGRRLAFLERYASLPQTMLRHITSIIIALIFGCLLGWFLHSLI